MIGGSPTSLLVMQRHAIFNIRSMLEKFFYFQRIDHTFSPDLHFHRSYYPIFFPDYLRMRLRKDFGHVMLEIVLVGNDELAFRAVAACFSKNQEAESIDMDEQGKFPHVGESATPRALAPPCFGVLIQSKTITWRQLSQLSFWHEINPSGSGSLLMGTPGSMKLSLSSLCCPMKLHPI